MTVVDERAAAFAKLREQFPAENIAKLPKVNCYNCTEANKRQRGAVCGEHRKAKCPDCGNYITTGHIHLDYVGHAEATARLLDADPEWTWEPMSFGPDGLPQFDKNGGLWIRLTVAGVTRVGYGDAAGKSGPNAIKEAIGDAIRNASMRFGLALDLWAKTDLHAAEHAEEPSEPERPAERSQPSGPAPDQWSTPAPAAPVADREQVDHVLSGMRAVRGIDNDRSMRSAIEAMVRREVTDPYTLTPTEAADIIATLTAEHNVATAAADAGPTPNNPAPSAAKTRMMHAAFKTAGIVDHDGRVGYANWVIYPSGRTVDSTSKLTAADVAAVCDALAKGLHPELTGRAAELSQMVASATTSDELAAISDRLWTAHRGSEITDYERDLLISASTGRERELAQKVRAAA